MKYIPAIMAAAGALGLAALLPAAAAEKVAPQDIKAAFGTGKAFTAEAPSGSTLTLTFNPDGSASAVQKGKKKGNAGTWRVSDTGYCTTWAKATEKCYTVQKNGDHYDVLNEKGIIVA